MTRLDFINRRLAEPPPATPVAAAYAFLCIAAPTALRALADPVVTGTTYGTYYPFVLLASLFLGWRLAVAVTIAGSIVGNILFVEPQLTFFPTAGERFSAVLFLVSSAMIIAAGNTLRRSVADLHEAREHEEHLNRELQHRVKNTLAVVQGLVTQTFRGTPEAKEPLGKLQGRLRALADANDILRDGEWEGCCLPDLAVRALDPFNGGGAISLIGPECSLPDESCVPLVLALHELATNAVKYGSLSTDEGTVDLGWEVTSGGDSLVLTWAERSGPPVEQPVHTGLGSKLLRPGRGLASVDVRYNPVGLSAQIMVNGVQAIPAAILRNPVSPAAMHAIGKVPATHRLKPC
jgi:two-component sensor histidine kinase